MAKQKVKSGWVNEVLNFLNDVADKIIEKSVVDKIVERSDAKIEELKKKIVGNIIVYGIFTMALFFVLLGFTKYLAETYVFASEGIAFMVVGSIMIVVLSAFTMIKKI